MDDVKPALDKAAASPDPAVRSMALQYTEARNKLMSLEAFFAFYAEGVQALSGKQSAAQKPVPRTPSPMNAVKPANSNGHGKPNGAVKTDEFTQTILAILKESAKPIPLPDLQMIYESLKLEPPLQSETFRQRMISRQRAGIVVLVPRVGFRLPGIAADSETGSEAAADA